jgi:hypothetical protein
MRIETTPMEGSKKKEREHAINKMPSETNG